MGHPTVCESRIIPLFYSFTTAADEAVSVYECEGFGRCLRRVLSGDYLNLRGWL